MPETQEILIEEYVPEKHAKSIADMWNRSFESWGGDNAYRTEQSVLTEHENSTLLKVFLAVADGEVIGYCSFSHYKEDSGALYIPLLNVRPDFHGRKVGKRLVRRAVEETIKLGWPRLDLYTWAGNVKAVPTYKKSGFFWEKRDETTHLMNFIPSVLQTGAVKHYFETIDWYNDSIREISVQPDGHKENGFDYFTYEWVKGGLRLKMEVERTGRGLRLIETEDYLITATIPDQHQLPFGATYPVVYEAVNKSGKPLSLQISGKGNPQISFELNETRVVAATERIGGRFFIHPVEEEQSVYQTHPVVEAELLINGLPAVFKLGVLPKYPVKVKLELPERTFYPGEKLELDVIVENEYSTDTSFIFSLPSDSILSFGQTELQIDVPAKGRRSLTIPGVLESYGIWHHTIEVRKAEGNTESPVLQQEISLVFPGADAAFGGKTNKEWLISSGRYSARLDKSDNTLKLYEGVKNVISLPFPKCGLPYTNEFKKNSPLEVRFTKENGAIVLEAGYKLSAKEGLLLTMVVKLHNNGLVSRHFRIHNPLDADQAQELILKDSFEFGLRGGVIPYNGKYLDLSQGADASSPDYWEVEKFTENWMYATSGESPRGISWPAELQLIQDSWMHAVEHSLGRIPAGGTVETGPLRMMLGTWSDWSDFRAYAQLQGNRQDLCAEQQLEVNINHGNPFVSGPLTLFIREEKKSYLDGEIRIDSSAGSIMKAQIKVQGSQQLSEISLPLNRSGSADPDLLNIHLDMDIYELDRSMLVFPVSDQPVVQQTLQAGKAGVLTADNGVLQIKASSDFAPGLFSLTHQGQEWLESSYPQPVPKSWWNPWVGGMLTWVNDISLRSYMEEPRTAAYAALKDNQGNQWSGIRMSVTFEKNIKYRGLTLHQYFMLLPGVPVLASTVQIEQNTGVPQYPLNLETSTHYHAASDLMDSRGYLKNSSGESLVYKAGKVQLGARSASGIIQFGSRERSQRLTLLTASDLMTTALMANTHAMLSYAIDPVFVREGENRFTKPQFCILSDLTVPEQAYGDLRNIRFNSN